jgi:diadenosine tetraphosphate (Ap4A) HIT family hydrolase
MSYDKDNIFAKILRHEVPCKVVAENEFFLSFYDLYPKAKIHILVIPKESFENAFHFHEYATMEQIYGFYNGINQVISLVGLKYNGFKLISHNGVNCGQEIFHYHVHILSGETV